MSRAIEEVALMTGSDVCIRPEVHHVTGEDVNGCLVEAVAVLIDIHGFVICDVTLGLLYRGDALLLHRTQVEPTQDVFVRTTSVACEMYQMNTYVHLAKTETNTTINSSSNNSSNNNNTNTTLPIIAFNKHAQHTFEVTEMCF